MVDFVPLSSLNATDGNVVYTQTAVLRVGYGSNVTVASGLFEANGQVGVGTTVYNSASKLQVEGNIFAANGSSWFGNVAVTNTTATTSTATGALTVAGGVGIANGAIIAGNVGIGTASTTGFTNNALAVFGTTLHKGNIYVTNSSTTSGIIFSDGTFQASAASGTTLTIADDTTTNASRYITFTSATTGTISTLNTSSTKLTYNPLLATVALTGGNLTVSNSGSIGNLSITNTTATTSSTTGALTVAGGVGIAGNIYLGTTNSNVFNTVSPIFSNTGITSSTLNAINVLQTWNNASNAFTAVAINITDSSSSSGSTPISIIRNNTTQFSLPSSSISSWSDASVGQMYVTATSDSSTVSLSAINGPNYAGLQLKRYISSRGPGVLVSGLGFATTGYFSSTSLNSTDVLLTAGGTNSLQLGDADTATPAPFSFQMPSVVAGTSNTAGTDFLLQGSRGTGTGVGGRLIFGVSPAGSSGTAQNNISNVLIIDPSANVSTFSSAVTISNTRITTSSTSGALTVAGGVGIANGAVIAGNVGIGTSSTAGFTNNALAVFGTSLHKGNIYVTNTSTISGIVFSDGTFQNTATINGPTGPTGPSSPSTSIFQYQALTTTNANAYPGDGNIVWNNSTTSSVTNIYVSHLTDIDQDIDVILSLLTAGQQFIIQDQNSSENYQQWQISSVTHNNAGTSTSYFDIGVTLITSAGTGTGNFSNLHPLFLTITTGIYGPTGYTGPSVTGPTGYTGPSVTGPTGPQSIQVVISYTTANSSTTAFSSSPYTSTNSYVQVYVDGIYQPSSTYTWSGTNVTLTSPPPNNTIVELMITTASPSLQTNPNSIIVGSTVVTSGTSGYVLYNNSGAVGNLPTSGTGSVVLTNAPALTGNMTTTGNIGIGTSTVANSNLYVVGTANLVGSASQIATILTNAAEPTTVNASALTGTISFDVTSQSVVYYTGNASGNWTVNFRGSSSTSLNTLMSIGQTVTAALMVTQGGTAYYNSAVTIDGGAVTPKWQGGTAPSAGYASSVDVYQYSIVKTANATFTVFASQTQYK